MAAQPAVGSNMAWYSDPDFAAARNRTIPPGGATTYAEPPPVGTVPQDMTDFIYGQATWSSRHMPNILYRLRPNHDWVLFKKAALPFPKVDAQGQDRFEQWPVDPANPRPLLDFEVLPDRVGSQEHWWRFEAWRRLDPRIRWSDISMRMEPPYRISDVLLRSRVSRPRIHFSILSWFQHPRGLSVNNKIMQNLTHAQIQANTTRGSTPGLIDPAQGQDGGRVYRPDEGPEDDTASSSASGSESESDSDDDVDNLIVPHKRSEDPSPEAALQDDEDEITTEGTDDSEDEEEEDEKESVEEQEVEEQEPERNEEAAEEDSDKFYDSTEGPPTKRRRTDSLHHSVSTEEQTPGINSMAFEADDNPATLSRLTSPVRETPLPRAPTDVESNPHGSFGLPADSRDFDPNGNFIPDANARWQIDETARWKEDMDKDRKDSGNNPDA